MRERKTSESTRNNSSDSNVKRKRMYRAIPIGQMLKFNGRGGMSLNQKLNEELIRAYETVKLGKHEIERRNKVFKRLKEIIEDAIECRVEVHGSFSVGTMVYGSDIDITVLTDKAQIKAEFSGDKNTDADETKPKDITDKGHCNYVLAKIAAILESSDVVKKPTAHVRNARVPVLKCVDAQSGCQIDVVVDQYDVIRRSRFMEEELTRRPYLKYLVVLLKYFLKRRHLSEVIRGGLSSYGQFLMVLSFVQLHPLIQNGNIRVEENLGTILMDFFQLYGLEFPFEIATISVLDVKYKPNRDSQVNIEDPCNPGHNVTAGCTALPMIREIFAFSYKIMAAAFAERVNPNKAIGELWLHIDEQEMALRKKANAQ